MIAQAALQQGKMLRGVVAPVGEVFLDTGRQVQAVSMTVNSRPKMPSSRGIDRRSDKLVSMLGPRSERSD